MRGLEGGSWEEEERLPSMKAPLNNKMRGRRARTVLAPPARVLVRLVRSDLSSRLGSITTVNT